MKKCFVILTLLLLGFVFAGHKNSLPTIHKFGISAYKINKTLEINNNNTFNIRNFNTDLFISDYSLNNHNKKSLQNSEINADFVKFEKFYLYKKRLLSTNNNLLLNKISSNCNINPRAP